MSEQRKITAIVEALEELSESIKNATNDVNTLQSMHGWNFPPIGRDDFVTMLDERMTKLSGIGEDKISTKYSPESLIERINLTRTQVVPNLFTGNGREAAAMLSALCDHIDNLFWKLFDDRDWESLIDSGKIPKILARRLRALKSNIEKQTEKAGDLEAKIDAIDSAHATADSLPTDLEALNDARLECETTLKTLNQLSQAATADAARTEKALASASRDAETAKATVEQIEDAYSAATTKGLGQAFQQRATALSWSMWIWVFGLALALAAGAYIGTLRVQAVQTLIDKNADSAYLWIQSILAFFSVAAPVWFAWIATKQIGQRFRLAEDYGFKASVARAYEGYRREAIKLDEAFAARLFSSALDRLDEAPLRFVENENFGSPFHEAMSNNQRSSAALAGVKSAAAAVIGKTRKKKVNPSPQAQDEGAEDQ